MNSQLIAFPFIKQLQGRTMSLGRHKRARVLIGGCFGPLRLHDHFLILLELGIQLFLPTPSDIEVQLLGRSRGLILARVRGRPRRRRRQVDRMILVL